MYRKTVTEEIIENGVKTTTTTVTTKEPVKESEPEHATTLEQIIEAIKEAGFEVTQF